MAKAPSKKKEDTVTERTPIAERGLPLLALIAAAANGRLALTQEEGAEIVAAGHAAIDANTNAGEGLASVYLTDAGIAALDAAAASAQGNTEGTADAGTTAPAAAAPVATGFKVSKAVPIPTTKAKRKGTGSIYPFDKLEIGDSFHVPKTADRPDPASSLASSVSGARVQFSEIVMGEDGKTPVMEEVTVIEYAKDAHGKFLKDSDGKRVKSGEKKVNREQRRLTRDFLVKSVDGTDPEGEGARVWRVPLSA